jgi:hypothetical protein
MAPISFECNVAYSLAVNKGLASDHPDVLSQAELWEGVRRGCMHPHEFAPYVSKCEVLSGDTNNFVRRLTLADGAVHTASGATIDQEVVIAEGLHVSCLSFGEERHVLSGICRWKQLLPALEPKQHGWFLEMPPKEQTKTLTFSWLLSTS